MAFRRAKHVPYPTRSSSMGYEPSFFEVVELGFVDFSLQRNRIDEMKVTNDVVILSTKRKKKSGLEEAMDDIRCGRVTTYKNADDMFERLGI